MAQQRVMSGRHAGGGPLTAYAGRPPLNEHSTLQKTSTPRQTAPDSMGAAHEAQKAGVPLTTTFSGGRAVVLMPARPRRNASRSPWPANLPTGNCTIPIPPPRPGTLARRSIGGA